MTKLITKRNTLGAIFFLLLVGELTVGLHNGLFTPVGAIVLYLLYFFYFVFLESLIVKYKLTNLGVVFINFALYSVLITGFLHGELKDYVLHPENNLTTTLIRIQCSFYPLFAFSLVNKFAPRKYPTLTVKRSFLFFIVYIALLSFSGSFGFGQLIDTFKTATGPAIVGTILALLACIVAFRWARTDIATQSSHFIMWSLTLLFVSLIPHIAAFLTLLILSIVVCGYYFTKKHFRNSII